MKKFKNVIFWLALFIIIFTIIAIKPLSDLDELWNFNISRCITNGMIPYKDISMVVTPLFGLLLAIPLKLFGQELYIERLFLVILIFSIFILEYNIMRKLKINKEISLFITGLSISVLQNSFVIGYNLLVLILLMIIILIELHQNKEEKSIKSDIFIGILSGLIICTKQSMGIIIGFVAITNLLFFIKSKNDIKPVLKHILFRLCGIVVPVIILLIYLIANNALNDFFDYAIWGMKTFSNKLSYKILLYNKAYIATLSILVPIVLVISIITNGIMKFKEKENKNLFILTVYSLAMFSLIYPIPDVNHFSLAIIPAIILTVFLIDLILKKYVKFNCKYIMEFLNIFTILGILFASLYIELINAETLGNLTKYNYEKHYKYVYVKDEVYNSIEVVNNYIKSSEKKVYILDATASAYMIPLDRYNKDYDMFCIGNFGKNGENGIIEKIKSEDALYLIIKDSLNWQNPNNVRLYIKENMEYVSDINGFEIYKNK